MAPAGSLIAILIALLGHAFWGEAAAPTGGHQPEKCTTHHRQVPPAAADRTPPVAAPGLYFDTTPELARELAIISHDVRLVERWASRERPLTYAGIYNSPQREGRLVVGFTQDQRAAIAALRQRSGLRERWRIVPFPERPHNSLHALERTEEEIWKRAPRIWWTTGLLVGLETDTETNAVRVGSERPGLLRVLLRRFLPSGLPIRVTCDEEAEEVSTRPP